MSMEWQRKGFCIRCGACCNYNNFPKLKNFQLNPDVEFDEKGWCKHYDQETRLCKIYKNRPRICSEFPRGPSEIVMLPQCTYYFEAVER